MLLLLLSSLLLLSLLLLLSRRLVRQRKVAEADFHHLLDRDLGGAGVPHAVVGVPRVVVGVLLGVAGGLAGVLLAWLLHGLHAAATFALLSSSSASHVPDRFQEAHPQTSSTRELYVSSCHDWVWVYGMGIGRGSNVL